MTKITGFKEKCFCGSNALWNYVMVNASLRSYINHRDQSGLSRLFLQRGKMGGYSQRSKAVNIFKALWKAINKFKAIINLKAKGFLWI